MDIVKHIKQHTENLQRELTKSSVKQRTDLKIATLGFYFQLPNYDQVIEKYIKINFDRNLLIADIYTENVKSYQKIIEKINSDIDVYSNDYEEPEPVEIFILDAFNHAVSDVENTDSLAGLFIGIIDTLDYYENFSNVPDYWSTLVENEFIFQNEILNTLKSQIACDILIYQKRYKNVEFSE